MFELTMMNESEGITLDKTYPISDEEGLSTTGYTFTIKNTCNTYATYEVNLEDMLVEAKRLSGEYIKISINDGRPINLKELEEKEPTIEESDKAYELTSGSLGPEEETTYTIKLWMDESTPALEETMNATFLSKVSIEAGYIPEENLENEILLNVSSLTESLNNKSEIFEITGTSTNYNLIEYSLDNLHWNRIESSSKNIVITEEFTEEGKYTIYVRDEVGNIESIEFETEKLDKTVPAIKIEETDNQENIELNITFTDNEGLSGYQITTAKEEPTEWNEISGKETTILYTLTENTTYYIWVKDSVGNLNYQMYSTDTIDTQAPELTISNILTEWGTSDTITIQATDDVIGISGISISTIEDTYNWEVIENTLSYETTKEITSNGTYYISVRDGYGHITTKSIVIDKVDNTTPSASYGINSSTTGSNGWYKALTVQANLSDNESGVSSAKYCTTTGSACTPNVDASISNNTFTVILGSNASAQKVCTQVADKIGNISEVICSSSYNVDTTNPTVTISASVSGNTITVRATGSDAHSGIASYQYSRDNSTWYTSTSGTYNFTELGDGDYTLYVRSIDKSGRASNTVSTIATVAYTNVYVSSSGNDSTGNGSSSKPYATIQTAYEKVANGGNILLLSDITLNSTNYFNASKNLTLKSNAGNIYAIYRNTSDVLLYFASGSFTLENITIDGKNLPSTEAMIIVNDSILNLNQNTVISNAYSETAVCSTMWIAYDSTLNVNGATLINNTSTNQANILISDDPIRTNTLNFSSGIFSENNGYYGNIINHNNLNIQGGSFYNNEAINSGGVVSNNGTLILSGGEMYSNKAGLYGGAIYNSANGTITMTDGTIRNNQANFGGGIALGNETNTFTFNGGSIINNVALTNGGGIYSELNGTYNYFSGNLSGNTPNDFIKE